MTSALESLIVKYVNLLGDSKNMHKKEYGALEYSYAGVVYFIYHPKSAEIFYSFDNFYKQFEILGFNRKELNKALIKSILDRYNILVKVGNTMCK